MKSDITLKENAILKVLFNVNDSVSYLLQKSGSKSLERYYVSPKGLFVRFGRPIAWLAGNFSNYEKLMEGIPPEFVHDDI